MLGSEKLESALIRVCTVKAERGIRKTSSYDRPENNSRYLGSHAAQSRRLDGSEALLMQQDLDLNNSQKND